MAEGRCLEPKKSDEFETDQPHRVRGEARDRGKRKGRTAEVFLVKQRETKSLKAGEKFPSRTGGLALGMRKRTRMAVEKGENDEDESVKRSELK